MLGCQSTAVAGLKRAYCTAVINPGLNYTAIATWNQRILDLEEWIAHRVLLAVVYAHVGPFVREGPAAAHANSTLQLQCLEVIKRFGGALPSRGGEDQARK